MPNLFVGRKTLFVAAKIVFPIGSDQDRTGDIYIIRTYFCGSLGSFFFFFFEAFGFRAGGALGLIVLLLLLRLGESFPTYGSGDGRLKVLAWKTRVEMIKK